MPSMGPDTGVIILLIVAVATAANKWELIEKKFQFE
ncbi:hypothetical protein Xmau_01458 [Xenorhabdus mauleonii]|uniref:Uncharacterized protein n=1 Tax=Xenorhabdus mauleonii TaxID=351675 RepID=A0A1I3PMU1_9GAMM|nr:hypothetical protein Xmau_01458 [Xenorhabdus mauleonii]SFJ22878.1 hypothetical protein SAMN05421680_106203 [Xenorhabdus mauleonii]